VGAFDYYKAANEGPEGEKLVCFPNPEPSRNEAVSMFVDWAKAHPQYMSEAPVETEFRFLMDKWPCKE
ncbi:MAG: Rap1a/Tai family immunity protein, partial [bacterium]